MIKSSPFISVSLFEEYQDFRSDRMFLGNSVSWENWQTLLVEVLQVQVISNIGTEILIGMRLLKLMTKFMFPRVKKR